MTLRTRAAAVAGSAAAALAVAAPALAVGTGGVELTPLSGGNQQASSFHVHLAPGKSSTQRFVLHNQQTKPAQFALYAAEVTRARTGSFSVGGPGTAPWIALRTQTMTLGGGQSRLVTFRVHRTPAQHGPVAYGAVVLAMTDRMVVSRAAAMVYLERPGADPVRRAVVPSAIAAAVIAIGLLAHGWLGRRRRRLDAPG